MTVSTQRVAVDSSVDPADASGLRVGQDAEIEASDLQITLKAKFTEIASSTGTKGAAAGRIYVELTPAEDGATQPPAPSASDPAVSNGQLRAGEPQTAPHRFERSAGEGHYPCVINRWKGIGRADGGGLSCDRRNNSC